MSFKYNLISISQIDYHLLLQSERPEEKILAILGSFTEGDATLAVENIVNQINKVVKGEFSKARFIRQLLILAQLRNLKPENLKIMDDTSGIFSEEKDLLYQRGKIKEARRYSLAVVENLLRETNFSVAKIAKLATVTEAFVKEVKNSIKQTS